MAIKQFLKKVTCDLVLLSGVARVGRNRNRDKLLVVMYHGITRNRHDDPVWTQLPVDLFEAQLDFLQHFYQPVTLNQVLRALRREEELPERSLLITFDDGLKNNFTVAWPILRLRKLPAVIFLTVDYIGGKRMLWPDELYLLVKGAHEQGRALPGTMTSCCAQAVTVWQRYALLIEAMKRMEDNQRQEAMDSLRRDLPLSENSFNENFSMLNWHDVEAMSQESLIDFGVHTATHKILSRITSVELGKEVVQPKKTLEEKLGREVSAFCYPNGRSGLDFDEEHKALLRQSGYCCAFTTDHGLHGMGSDPFAIKRVAAGNDMTSYPAFFQLACAGIL